MNQINKLMIATTVAILAQAGSAYAQSPVMPKIIHLRALAPVYPVKLPFTATFTRMDALAVLPGLGSQQAQKVRQTVKSLFVQCDKLQCSPPAQ